MKLVSKIRINSRYVKKYDSPKTPYQRLIDSEHVSDHTKKRLTETFLSLNPFALKKMIESKLKIIFNTLQRPSLGRFSPSGLTSVTFYYESTRTADYWSSIL